MCKQIDHTFGRNFSVAAYKVGIAGSINLLNMFKYIQNVSNRLDMFSHRNISLNEVQLDYRVFENHQNGCFKNEQIISIEV